VPVSGFRRSMAPKRVALGKSYTWPWMPTPE
jgi:hypothetical protein